MQVKWEDIRMLDRDTRPIQLKALHIQKTLSNNRLKRDGGYELPGRWIMTMKKLGGGVSSSQASGNTISARPLHRTLTAYVCKLRSHAYKLPSYKQLASRFPEDD